MPEVLKARALPRWVWVLGTFALFALCLMTAAVIWQRWPGRFDLGNLFLGLFFGTLTLWLAGASAFEARGATLAGTLTVVTMAMFIGVGALYLGLVNFIFFCMALSAIQGILRRYRKPDSAH